MAKINHPSVFRYIVTGVQTRPDKPRERRIFIAGVFDSEPEADAFCQFHSEETLSYGYEKVSALKYSPTTLKSIRAKIKLKGKRPVRA